MKCLIHRRTFIYYNVEKNVMLLLYIGIIVIDFVGSVVNRITPKSPHCLLQNALSQREVVIPSSDGYNMNVNKDNSDVQFSSNSNSVSCKRNKYLTAYGMLDVDMHNKAGDASDINNIQRSSNNVSIHEYNQYCNIVFLFLAYNNNKMEVNVSKHVLPYI